MATKMINQLKSLYRFASKKHKTLFLEYPTDFKPRYTAQKPHPLLLELIRKNEVLYAEQLEACLAHKDRFFEIKQQQDEKRNDVPTWNNGFLPGLDIIMLYSLLAKYKPKKYIEVGSGNSTKVSFKAKQEQVPDMQIISVDPFPRAEIDQLSDEIHRLPLEDLDLKLFHQLEANDVLFIDNSHRILPNSDCTVVYLDILPYLKKGVIVHIHDIYLPYDYPQFMCDRFYSEQYGLACFLLANPERYKVLAPNFYISEQPELAKILNPLWDNAKLQQVEQHGGSFWFQIN